MSEMVRGEARKGKNNEEKIDPFMILPFIGMHLACLLALWVGVSWIAVATCLALHAVRMFGLTAGYHRYFSHRTFKTSRPFQFLLGLLGTTAVQKGPLWWAAHHRHHHAYSDKPEDLHSPLQRGFWWSHMGWFLCRKYDATNFRLIPDLAKFRELRWLNQYHLVPPVALAVALFGLGALLEAYAPGLGTSGGQLLVWGFFVSTVLLYHTTYLVNSLNHVWGTRRFETKDDSRNNFLIALVTLGEGWHNNHHHYPASERQGFYWWEVDMAHYVLKLFSWVGLVSDLKTPPRRILEQAGRAIIVPVETPEFASGD
jgi:stearoyl-CoA desaturase (Delta-9 desaturase)